MTLASRSRSGSHREKGGIIFGLLLSALVMICLTIAVGFWVSRNVRVNTVSGRNGENVSIDTPVGSLNVRGSDTGLSPAALGIPNYPGARTKKHDHGGGATVEWTSRDGLDDKGFSVSGIEMITSDPADKVAAFYRDQLPNWIVKKERGHKLQFELRDGGYTRIVAIDEKRDGTHIGIATVGEPPAN